MQRPRQRGRGGGQPRPGRASRQTLSLSSRPTAQGSRRALGPRVHSAAPLTPAHSAASLPLPLCMRTIRPVDRIQYRGTRAHRGRAAAPLAVSMQPRPCHLSHAPPPRTPFPSSPSRSQPNTRIEVSYPSSHPNSPSSYNTENMQMSFSAHGHDCTREREKKKEEEVARSKVAPLSLATAGLRITPPSPGLRRRPLGPCGFCEASPSSSAAVMTGLADGPRTPSAHRARFRGDGGVRAGGVLTRGKDLAEERPERARSRRAAGGRLKAGRPGGGNSRGSRSHGHSHAKKYQGQQLIPGGRQGSDRVDARREAALTTKRVSGRRWEHLDARHGETASICADYDLQRVNSKVTEEHKSQDSSHFSSSFLPFSPPPFPSPAPGRQSTCRTPSLTNYLYNHERL
ncbi:hypothetical protein C7M84_016705 [Penaeus vannamei]|uniref:Uncharacterized protein n=1 Tax=Penaeus vannamei TaxID=6689 RepID=A0A423SMG2_PENVA|nr:hypothetical protein C7M84_016705 [Penaeus vannamei]